MREYSETCLQNNTLKKYKLVLISLQLSIVLYLYMLSNFFFCIIFLFIHYIYFDGFEYKNCYVKKCLTEYISCLRTKYIEKKVEKNK